MPFSGSAGRIFACALSFIVGMVVGVALLGSAQSLFP